MSKIIVAMIVAIFLGVPIDAYLSKKKKRPSYQKSEYEKAQEQVNALYKKIREEGWNIDESNYTPERMGDAYEKLVLHDMPAQSNGDISELAYGLMGDDKDDNTVGEIEIAFYIPKEQANPIVKSLFQVLYILDLYMNNEFCRVPCDIQYIDIYDGEAMICYYNLYGEDIKVNIFLEQGKWYCTAIFGKIFEPPVSIANGLVAQTRKKD